MEGVWRACGGRGGRGGRGRRMEGMESMWRAWKACRWRVRDVEGVEGRRPREVPSPSLQKSHTPNFSSINRVVKSHKSLRESLNTVPFLS